MQRTREAPCGNQARQPGGRARGNASGALSREALDAATVTSGPGIKPGEALHGETLHREPLDAGDR